MPFGELLDQWEIYKQYNGMTKTTPKETIDDAIPFGI